MAYTFWVPLEPSVAVPGNVTVVTRLEHESSRSLTSKTLRLAPKNFSMLSGLVQHLRSGAYAGGRETLRLAAPIFGKRLSNVKFRQIRFTEVRILD